MAKVWRVKPTRGFFSNALHNQGRELLYTFHSVPKPRRFVQMGFVEKSPSTTTLTRTTRPVDAAAGGDAFGGNFRDDTAKGGP